MRTLMKETLLLTLLSAPLLYGEVSAFGAGDLDSDNPYGLSESEKVIFANKKATLQNRRDIKSLKLKISDMQESLEGLRSVVESLSEKVGQTGRKLHEMDAKPQEDVAAEIAKLREEMAAQKAQNARMMETLKKLTVMIDNIGSDYVRHSDLAKLKKKVGKSQAAHAAPKAKSKAQRLKEAIAAYRKKRYDAAQSLFETLDAQNYKRATANYYLGEISYYRKAYADAIVYYKKSANLYDKASYMPTLLLHTALSFKKLGEKENAKRFFEAVIANYPESRQAKIAEKNL